MRTRYQKPYAASDDSDSLASPARNPWWIRNRSKGAIAHKPRIEQVRDDPYHVPDNEAYIPGPTPYPFTDYDADEPDYNDINNSGDDVFLHGYPRDPNPSTPGPYAPVDLHNDLVETSLRRNDIAWRNEVRAHIRHTRRARSKTLLWKRRATKVFLWFLVSIGLLFYYTLYVPSPHGPLSSSDHISSYYPIPSYFSWMYKTQVEILQVPDGHENLTDVERAYKEKMRIWEEGGELCGYEDREALARDKAMNNGTVRENVCIMARDGYNWAWEQYVKEEKERVRGASASPVTVVPPPSPEAVAEEIVHSTV